jgi:hypothetical protein
MVKHTTGITSQRCWYEKQRASSRRQTFGGSSCWFPTTGCLELGKEADHQVRGSATSGFNSLTWMRLATGINLTLPQWTLDHV